MCTYGVRSHTNVHRLVVVVMVVEVACSKKGYSFWVRKFVSDGAVHQTPSMRHSLPITAYALFGLNGLI